MRISVLCVVLLLAAGTLPAQAQLQLQAPNPVALHAGSGAVTFSLINQNPKATAPIPLALTCGPILDATTQTIVKNATVSLTPVLGAPSLPVSIAPGQIGRAHV